MMAVVLVASLGAVNWQHPAGLITEDTVVEIREKITGQDWAKAAYADHKAAISKWVDVPSAKLTAVFPKKCGNVYHNFSCPDDRTRLDFDPFNPERFHCSTCGKDFSPDTDAGIYPPDNRYHGTMYDGWACLFYQRAASAAMALAVIGRVEEQPAYTARAIEILTLFAESLRNIPTDRAGEGQFVRILTYHREGDNKILCDLATAYELVRDQMSAAQRACVEQDVLARMLEDGMLEPVYQYNHNNLYQWHRTVLQAALALEREDLFDWSFGYGDHAPEAQPTHASLRRLAATHFKPDGAYWELCSGYHLYPLYHFCEVAVLSHNLSHMDPDRFPQARYDFTDRDSEAGKVIKNALEWFMSMAMPDRTMPTIGDSMDPRAGMDSYAVTAEVGYRFYDVRGVADYAGFREGRRSWVGVLYGAPEIVQQPTPFTSSYLSSGWVSLRNEWEGNRVWVGLNALLPGGGHQHADRLGLTWYSHGKLLALEKATPYNESVTRILGTLSPSHNTVTVDRTSQKQGEALQGEEIPEVALFFSGAFMQFAELRADRLYPQTTVYRRSVAVVEDIVLDLFRVEGGATHDWIVNHAGTAPALSIETEPAPFEPDAWRANGTDNVRHAQVAADWTAQWRVDGVTSRLTMIESPSIHPEATEVYALETYPVSNAVVTADHPPCQTLCVRRTAPAPFLAVWDAWQDAPNLQEVARAGDRDALKLRTKSNTYYALFGPGKIQFRDGVRLESNAAFSLLRNRDAVAFVGGTRFKVDTPEGWLAVGLSETGSAAAQWTEGGVLGDKVQAVQHDTFGGEDHRRPSASIAIRFDGNLIKATR